MYTATANRLLPTTVTGSWPHPRWFDVSMWSKPLDTCMMDVGFREKFQDALAVVVSDEDRAGLDSQVGKHTPPRDAESVTRRKSPPVRRKSGLWTGIFCAKRISSSQDGTITLTCPIFVSLLGLPKFVHDET